MDTTPSGGAAAAEGAAAGGVVREADVQQLVGLGFSREMAVGALQAANGNVDAAASMLFGM
jgi:DNA damage-inducible protein 1